MKKINLINIFISSLLMTSGIAYAGICPEGNINILCHSTDNGLSLTGCFDKGLAYLCTTDLKSCSDVRAGKASGVNWSVANYNPEKMRFTCPNQGRSHHAEKLTMDSSSWHKLAKRVVHGGENICPAQSLPVLCHQQQRGVSLIGCSDNGLRYLCTKKIKTCKEVNDASVSKADWIDARYDQANLEFQCGHGASLGKARRTLSDDSWHRAIDKAR